MLLRGLIHPGASACLPRVSKRKNGIIANSYLNSRYTNLVCMPCLVVPIMAVSRVLVRVSVRVCMTVGMGVDNVPMGVLMGVLMRVRVRVRLLKELVRAVGMGVLMVVGVRVFVGVGCFFVV